MANHSILRPAFLALVVFALLPLIAFGQADVDQGGTGRSSVPTGALLTGNGIGPLGVTFSPTVANITATSGTSTFPNVSITGAISLIGEYITDLAATIRAKISETITGVDYSSSTGVFSLTSGYSIPLTASTTNWQTAFNWGNHASQGYITDGNTGWDNSYNLFDKDTDTTANITESGNLFYTDARVGTYISASTTVPHVGGSAVGDILRWTGSAWGTMATSGINYQWGNLGGIPAGFADGVDAGGVWGSITGTLSSQTDLQTALDAKLSLSAFYSTTTQDIAESGNLYYTDARVGTYVNASTSIPSTPGTVANAILKWNGTRWLPAATSTLYVNYSDLVVDADDISESAINFSTVCGSGSKLYISGTNLACGTDATGGGNGLATSTPIVDTYVIYGTSPGDVGAEAAFTYDDATNLLTVSNASTTYTSATTFYGALTGTASLATALGANGSNCSAGSFPLGVDASGAVETCTDAWTEAENTSAAYISASALTPYLTLSAFYATTTQDIAESGNLYYTDARVNSYVHGSTTIPKTYTANIFTALQTLGNASSTHLSISGNSYLGTVRTGLWNGTSLADAYVDDTITASNYLSLSAFYSTTTQDIAESGNLYYTDARVNSYIHGSTTVPKTYTANTFTGLQTIGNASTTHLSVSGNSYLGTVRTGTWNGTAIGDSYLTKSGDWTGTIDGNDFSGGAIGAGQLLYGTGAGTLGELTLGASSTILTNDGTSPRWLAGSALCVAITGSASLCDGDDATGAGGGITSLAGLTNSTQTFATSSDTNIGLSIVSSGSTHTFTPSWSGSLAVSRGGTGWNNLTANTLLYGNGTGAIATSSFLRLYETSNPALDSVAHIWANSSNEMYLRTAIDDGRVYFTQPDGANLLTLDGNNSIVSTFARLDINGVNTSTFAAGITIEDGVLTVSSTTATSTLPHLTGSFLSGYGLSSCTGSSNKITWEGGTFRCETDQTGGVSGSGATNMMAYWTGSGAIGATSSPTVGYLVATSTTATTSLQRTSITGAVSILGEYFTNFTTYVRSLFTGGNGITITSGSIAVGTQYTTGKLMFFYASTTQGAATTTRYLGPAPYNLTVTTAQCDFSTFMNVSLYDGTNRADLIRASSTVGTTTFSTNAAFSQGEPMRIDVGTSTNIAASVNGGCTIKYTY